MAPAQPLAEYDYIVVGAGSAGCVVAARLGDDPDGVPDIAMDADAIISPGAYFSGGVGNPQGGTSLASPLALGSWARFESGHANKLAFAAPLPYAQSGTAGFHDITQGDCEPYLATAGYDFCTGLGSFDVGHMEKLIQPATAQTAAKS